MHRRNDGVAIDAQRGEFDVGDLDKDFLVLISNDVHLGHILDMHEFAADTISVDLFIGETVAFPSQRENIAEGITKLVVEKRALTAAGQSVANIADALSHLILNAGYVGRRYCIVDKEKYLALAGAGITSDVEVRQFFETFFDLVGDLLLDLACRGTGPDGAHCHDLERKRRVLRLAQFAV